MQKRKKTECLNDVSAEHGTRSPRVTIAESFIRSTDWWSFCGQLLYHVSRLVRTVLLKVPAIGFLYPNQLQDRLPHL